MRKNGLALKKIGKKIVSIRIQINKMKLKWDGVMLTFISSFSISA
jgi:hypothetical protein